MTASLTNSTTFVASSVSTSQSITIPSTAAGATVILYQEGGANDGVLSSVSGGGGTWTQLQALNDANNTTSVWIGTGLSTGTTSITLTLATADNPVCVAEEWAGITSTVDVKATVKSSTASTSWTSNASGTTTNADDVVLGAAMGWTGTSAPTITPTGSPWTNQTAAKSSSGSNVGVWVQTGYQVISSTGSFTYSGTVSISSTYHAYCIVLKQATSTITGSFSLQLPALAQAFAGVPTIAESFGLQLPARAQAFAGVPTIAGSFGLQLPARALAFTGRPGITGSFSLQLAALAESFTSLPRSLIMSLAPAAGSDPYGNAYPAGVSVGALGSQQVQLLLAGLLGQLAFPSGASFEEAGFAAGISVHVLGSGGTEFIQLIIASAADQATGQQVYMELNTCDESGAGSANQQFVYTGPGGAVLYGQINDAGFSLPAASVTGIHPGSSPASSESWQSAAAGGSPAWSGTVYYKKCAENEILLYAALTAPSSTPVNNNTIVTLPTGYRPANLGVTFGITSSSGTNATATLGTDGTLHTNGVTSASSTVNIGPIRLPLDLP